MATAPTVPDQNAAQLSPEQIAEQLANQAVQSSEPPQLQREYVIQTETGQTFRGRTQQELIDAMKKSVEEGTKTIAELNREKKQVAPPPAPQPQQPQFDSNKYYELWASNPTEALNYQLKSQYGVTLEDVVQRVNDASNFAQEVRPKTIIADWQSKSDFPTSDPAELSKAGDAMQQAWDKFFPQGTPITEQNLELVHNYCLRQGMYRSETELKQTASPQNNVQLPPPPPSDGGGFTQSANANPANMSVEQLRQILDNLNPQG